MREAATALLSAVQEKAKLLLKEEEHAIEQLMAEAVHTQLRRLEVKMSHLDELSNLLQRERENLERTRHVIIAERLSLDQRRLQAASAPAQAPPPTAFVPLYMAPQLPQSSLAAASAAAGHLPSMSKSCGVSGNVVNLAAHQRHGA